jgi:hypothetical protein
VERFLLAGVQVFHGVSRGGDTARPATGVPAPGTQPADGSSTTAFVGKAAMTAARTASAAGVATLVMLLAGCGRSDSSEAVAAAPPASAAADSVVASGLHKTRASHGFGIRPTGSTANGITP